MQHKKTFGCSPIIEHPNVFLFESKRMLLGTLLFPQP